jgi:hypothetical protein
MFERPSSFTATSNLPKLLHHRHGHYRAHSNRHILKYRNERPLYYGVKFAITFYFQELRELTWFKNCKFCLVFKIFFSFLFLRRFSYEKLLLQLMTNYTLDPQHFLALERQNLTCCLTAGHTRTFKSRSIRCLILFDVITSLASVC